MLCVHLFHLSGCPSETSSKRTGKQSLLGALTVRSCKYLRVEKATGCEHLLLCLGYPNIGQREMSLVFLEWCLSYDALNGLKHFVFLR